MKIPITSAIRPPNLILHIVCIDDKKGVVALLALITPRTTRRIAEGNKRAITPSAIIPTANMTGAILITILYQVMPVLPWPISE